MLANIQANGNRDDPRVVAEWEEIYTVLMAEREAPKTWRKFVYKGMWRRTLAGMSVQYAPSFLPLQIVYSTLAGPGNKCLGRT